MARKLRHFQAFFWLRVFPASIPCVFINAAEDIRPNWPTQRLAEMIPGGQYIEIAGAAHCIWLTHAAALQAALHRALAHISTVHTG